MIQRFIKIYLMAFALTIIIGFAYMQFQPHDEPVQIWNQGQIQNDDPNVPQPTETPITLKHKAIIWDISGGVIT